MEENRLEQEWSEMETRDLLVVIDMQNDFITGPLGTAEAHAIVPKVKAKID